MPQPLIQIKNRIRSVENTKKVTAAMEMISVAKLNRIDKLLYALRPYALEMSDLLNSLTAGCDTSGLPLFEARPSSSAIALCVITSDSGLCSLYNQNIIRAADEFIKSQSGLEIKLILVGQKGFVYFRSRYPAEIINSYLGLNARYSDKFCQQISDELTGLFLNRQADKIYICYTHFKNSLIQKPMVEQFLGLKAGEIDPVEYILEPGLKSILADLVPQFLKIKMRLILLEAFTSEHAARAVAMKTATDNAKELLEDLILLRNKIRQAGITQEMLEIISSVEALKG